MLYSYDEILERMENKYFELTGHEAEECGDIGIRLKLLAGELYSLQSNFDWLKRQMLFTTATGEQLDMYAMQRGIKRIKGNKSSGELVVVLDNALDYEMEIPKGTICTTADGSLNFIIDEATKVLKGSVRTICRASAEHTGKKYNVSKNTITTMVTYFSAGMYIENGTAFTGGTDDETDEELRKRIEATYRNISNGANAAYYCSLAESVDGVQSAAVIESSSGDGSASIYVAGRGGLCDQESLSKVTKVIKDGKCIGHNIRVLNATTSLYNVSIKVSVKSGFDTQKVIADVENGIRNYFKSLRVGQGVILAEIGCIIMNTDGVENYVFNNMQDKSAAESVLIIIGSLDIGTM